jgi:hypothetical protein
MALESPDAPSTHVFVSFVTGSSSGGVYDCSTTPSGGCTDLGLLVRSPIGIAFRYNTSPLQYVVADDFSGTIDTFAVGRGAQPIHTFLDPDSPGELAFDRTYKHLFAGHVDSGGYVEEFSDPGGNLLNVYNTGTNDIMAGIAVYPAGTY